MLLIHMNNKNNGLLNILYLAAGTWAWFVETCGQGESASVAQSCDFDLACCYCLQGWKTKGSIVANTDSYHANATHTSRSPLLLQCAFKFANIFSCCCDTLDTPLHLNSTEKPRKQSWTVTDLSALSSQCRAGECVAWRRSSDPAGTQKSHSPCWEAARGHLELPLDTPHHTSTHRSSCGKGVGPVGPAERKEKLCKARWIHVQLKKDFQIWVKDKRMKTKKEGQMSIDLMWQWKIKGDVANSYPFCRYTGMSSIAFRGTRRSSFRTCWFQEASLFLWVSEKAWHIDRQKKENHEKEIFCNYVHVVILYINFEFAVKVANHVIQDWRSKRTGILNVPIIRQQIFSTHTAWRKYVSKFYTVNESTGSVVPEQNNGQVNKQQRRWKILVKKLWL